MPSASLDALGDGPGFRKVRKGLDVAAFGVNAIVMPPGIESGFHYHDEQEELYFVHRGTIEMEFGDGTIHRMEEGCARARRRRHRAQGAQPGRGRCDLSDRRRQGRLHRPRRPRARGRGAAGQSASTISPASSRSEPRAAPRRREMSAMPPQRTAERACGDEAVSVAATIPLAEIVAAREPLLGAGRPARQRDRLARGSELRRARLASAQRVTARARARARRRAGRRRSPRTSARRRATASSRSTAWQSASRAPSPCPANAAPRARRRPRASGACRPSAARPSASASAARLRADPASRCMGPP